MSIKLDCILKRNNTNLEIFIQKNKLTTYKRLLEYCESRKFIPCTEEEYNKVTHEEVVQDGRKETGRKASKTQKKRKTRSSARTKQKS